jgi:hypothetical protein
MKKFITIITLVALLFFGFNGNAQERYGRTVNMGLGVAGYSGYSGYAGHALPVFHLNYEIDVARNFTLAPFISFYTFSDSYYWGNNTYPSQYYTYRETVIPIGLKGSYYFDELLTANYKWDFYAAGSVGVAVASQHWQDGYYGDRNHYHGHGPLLLDLHIGAEYHFNKKIGAFLDLSTGISTIGLAIH